MRHGSDARNLDLVESSDWCVFPDLATITSPVLQSWEPTGVCVTPMRSTAREPILFYRNV